MSDRTSDHRRILPAIKKTSKKETERSHFENSSRDKTRITINISIKITGENLLLGQFVQILQHFLLV